MCSGGLALGEIITPGELAGLPLRDQMTHPETKSGSAEGPVEEATLRTGEDGSSGAATSSSTTDGSDGALGEVGATGADST